MLGLGDLLTIATKNAKHLTRFPGIVAATWGRGGPSPGNCPYGPGSPSNSTASGQKMSRSALDSCFQNRGCRPPSSSGSAAFRSASALRNQVRAWSASPSLARTKGYMVDTSARREHPGRLPSSLPTAIDFGRYICPGKAPTPSMPRSSVADLSNLAWDC